MTETSAGEKVTIEDLLDRHRGMTSMQFQMVEDHFRDGLSVEQIAKRGGYSTPNVRDVLNRWRRFAGVAQ